MSGTGFSTTWSRAAGRGRAAKLKLRGSLRGAGVLVWLGGSVPVDYTLDVFRTGAEPSADGAAEGDFTVLAACGEGAISGVRLRLEDAHELAIEITTIEPRLVQFNVALTAADGTLLPTSR